MKKVFIFLWGVVALFVLGLALVIGTAFTMKDTRFGGQVDLYLKFETPEHKLLALNLTDSDGKPLKAESTGYVLVHPRFEARQTSFFDGWAVENGPIPRTAIVAFKEAGKNHEIQVVFDKKGHVREAIVQFPDPSINAVEVVNSSLDFKGVTGDVRNFESTIYAKASIGAPIITNE